MGGPRTEPSSNEQSGPTLLMLRNTALIVPTAYDQIIEGKELISNAIPNHFVSFPVFPGAPIPHPNPVRIA